MNSTLQIELKDGKMHDRHTIHYKGFANEAAIRKNIEEFMKVNSVHINRKFSKDYYLSYIELKGNNVGYGYIYFKDPAFYYMLTGRRPDGKENGQMVKNPNYISSEERQEITKKRIEFYRSKKDIVRCPWSWVCEYDYDDDENEAMGNTEYIFVKESFSDLGEYTVDDFCLRSIKSYISFKKTKEEDFSESSLNGLQDVKRGDKLKIQTSTMAFKFDNYIDTISISGFPLYMKNDEILQMYSIFFEEDIQKYVKKVVNKSYNNMQHIEVTFKLKQYAQLLNYICRNFSCDYKGEKFVLRNKPVNDTYFR